MNGTGEAANSDEYLASLSRSDISARALDLGPASTCQALDERDLLGRPVTRRGLIDAEAPRATCP
jgi:hypothetical protein